jgi:hypothetical protein
MMMKETESQSAQEQQRLRRVLSELRAINSQIKKMLDHLPLSDHREVLRLTRLVERQSRLMRYTPGPVPLAVQIFLDNEKFSASHLNQRYQQALMKGKIRKGAS